MSDRLSERGDPTRQLRPVRVLHLIDSLGAGGAERSLAEMAPRLAAYGVEPEIAVFHQRDVGVTEDVLAAGVRIHHVAGRSRPQRLWALRRLLAARRPDVLHTTLYEADVLGRIAGASLRIPMVTSLVNASYSSHRRADPRVRAWKLDAARRIDAFTARRLGAGFHAITHAVADAAVNDLGISRTQITVIPRGRSLERLGEPSPERRRKVRQRLGIDDSAFVVLNVGRREFQKGQDCLVQAAALLRDRACPVQLLIAGRDGSESTHLGRLTRELDLMDSVRFLGHVDDVPDLMAAADVFVFPSRFEGLGGAVLEALAMKVPIVATTIPALAEVLDNGHLGILVGVDDSEAIAAGIEAIRADPVSAEHRASAGREKKFLTYYALEAVCASMASWLLEHGS